MVAFGFFSALSVLVSSIFRYLFLENPNSPKLSVLENKSCPWLPTLLEAFDRCTVIWQLGACTTVLTIAVLYGSPSLTRFSRGSSSSGRYRRIQLMYPDSQSMPLRANRNLICCISRFVFLREDWIAAARRTTNLCQKNSRQPWAATVVVVHAASSAVLLVVLGRAARPVGFCFGVEF